MKKSIYLIIIFVVVLSFEARSEGLDFPDNYQEINAEHIASVEQELTIDRIDGSDGLDFWPGTYFIYKTNMGRYGKFIVEDLVETAGSKLTISWLTYDSDGSAYSSGSGLEVRGSWNCDLDEGLEGGYVQGQQDWQWRLMNPTSRYLLPVNGAKFKLIYKASSPSAQTEEPVHFADANVKQAVELALGITDPTPADMLSLTNLTVVRERISDLTGLEYAVNIRTLNLNYNRISDISPLSGFTNLENLSLYENQIRNISSLSGLTVLRQLTLGENQVSDLSSLSGLSSLLFIDIRDNQLRDLSPLLGCVNLEVLWVGNNWISDISVLRGLTRLRDLGIGNIHLSDLSLLSGFTNLHFLSLSYNQISDLSPLSEHVNLERLYLENNLINDISPLSSLTNLRELYLFRNQISDISALSGLTDMQELRLNYNQVSDISPLSNLTNLQNLRLGFNQVGDLSPLSGFVNLQRLYLIQNQISDISALSGLTSLQELNLGHNQISDVSALSGLISLQELLLGSNQISDISVLSGLTSLQKLFLRYNQISDISALSEHTNLEYLWLQVNPLNAEAYTIHIPLIQSYGAEVSYDRLVWRTLTISSTTGGSVVEPGEGDFDYTNLTIVNINAVADPGYYFVSWTGTAVDAGKVADPAAAGTTVTMEANYTLQANFEQIRLALYVDDDAPNDPAPNDPQVSDLSEDGSSEHPFDTVQEAIDVAGYGDTVLVYPGTYQEEINFLGKAITVQGVATSDGIPILENPGDFAVSFYYGEGPDSILKNFVIRNSFMAIFIAGSSPTITNLTLLDNKYGIEAYASSEPDISNSIFWNNTDSDLYQCEARYSCIKGAGQDNINTDPLFVDPNSGDYHLRSKRGRHWPKHDVWVLDNVTSPCIDAGDPTANSSGEPVPNGGRLNMGAYGGTAYASMSESSVTGEELPPEVIEQVHGITGGFHFDSTWFIAMFHNSSDYTITQVTINIRLTDRITGEQEWYVVVLGPPGAVIPPGETVILSGDVGVTRGDKDFYWEIVKMVGYID